MTDALSAHRLLFRLAQSGALLFAWIFIFEYFARLGSFGEAAYHTALTFCLAHAVAYVLTPFSARAVRNGVKSPTAKATLVLSTAYILLGLSLWGFVSQPGVWGIFAFAILFGVYRALYWISYRAHMGVGAKGRAYEIIVALMPLVFGYAAAFAPNPSVILIAAAVLVFLSLVPHLRIPDVVERYPWGAVETFREFFRSYHRLVVLRAAIDGAHSAALFLIWPLAVFMLLERSYALLGLVFSLTLLTVLFVRFTLRRFSSQSSVLHTPSVRAAHIVSAWIFRLVAATPIAIIAVGVYAHAYGSDREETDILAFEHTADQGVYLDEHTVLKEMGAAIGKVIAALM